MADPTAGHRIDGGSARHRSDRRSVHQLGRLRPDLVYETPPRQLRRIRMDNTMEETKEEADSA